MKIFILVKHLSSSFRVQFDEEAFSFHLRGRDMLDHISSQQIEDAILT